MSDKHTPKLPLSVDSDGDIQDSDGELLLLVASFHSGKEEYSKYIANCVNHHAELVEALREVSKLDQMSMENAVGWIEDNCRDIRELLAKLETNK